MQRVSKLPALMHRRRTEAAAANRTYASKRKRVKMGGRASSQVRVRLRLRERLGLRLRLRLRLRLSERPRPRLRLRPRLRGLCCSCVRVWCTDASQFVSSLQPRTSLHDELRCETPMVALLASPRR